MVPSADLVAMQRSAAMVAPGATLPVDRDQLYAMCAELIESRQLLSRLGSDLRDVAKRASR